MSTVPPQVLQTFLDETEERLGDMETGLMALRRKGSDADDNLVHSIFRHAHSVKAGANLLGFRNIESLAHKLENILDLMRNHRMSPDDTVMDSLIRALDRMHDLVDNIEQSDQMDIQASLEALRRATPGDLSTTA